MSTDPIEDLLVTAEEPWVPARAAFREALIAELRQGGPSRAAAPVVDLELGSGSERHKRARGSLRWLAAAALIVVALGVGLLLSVGGERIEPAGITDCPALRSATGDLELLVSAGSAGVDRDEVVSVRDALVDFGSGAGSLSSEARGSLDRVIGLLTQTSMQAGAGDDEQAGRTLSAARDAYRQSPVCR